MCLLVSFDCVAVVVAGLFAFVGFVMCAAVVDDGVVVGGVCVFVVLCVFGCCCLCCGECG